MRLENKLRVAALEQCFHKAMSDLRNVRSSVLIVFRMWWANATYRDDGSCEPEHPVLAIPRHGERGRNWRHRRNILLSNICGKYERDTCNCSACFGGKILTHFVGLSRSCDLFQIRLRLLTAQDEKYRVSLSVSYATFDMHL